MSVIENLAAEWSVIFDQFVENEEKKHGIPSSEWRVSKKTKTAKNPDGESLAWWKDNGLKQVETYIEWMKQSDWKIATLPDGKPAIEWEATVFFGGVPVLLFIDCVYESPNGEWIIVDYKSGASSPIGFEQLGLYASAIERAYGKRPKFGAFYSTRKGTLIEMVSLDPWGMDYFDYMFKGMTAQQEQGYYLPNVGMSCNMCGVKSNCIAWGYEPSKNFPFHQSTITTR